MSRVTFRFFATFCLCCLAMATWNDSLLADGASQPEKPLIVAIAKDYAPFTSVAPNGEPCGLFIDMWRLWSREIGVPIRFLPGTWEESLENVRQGEADVHSGLFRSKDRAEWLAFSEPLYKIRSAFYFRAEDTLYSLAALAGKKVGVVGATFQADFLRQHHPEVELIEYANTRSMTAGLISEEVDAIFAELPEMSQTLSAAGWQGLVKKASSDVLANTVHAGVLKSRESLLARIDKGFRSISPFALADLERHWLINPEDRTLQVEREESEVELSPEEREYIRNVPSIRLSSTPNWPPFEMEQENGAYAGIAADFIRLAANKVGLDIEPVFDAKWKQHVERLKNGTLEVAPGLNETDERKEYLIFTKPYLTYYSAIFTRNDRKDIQSLDDLKGKTVALEKGYALARVIAKDHPDINVKLVDTSFDAIQAVSLGKADAYIGNQVVAAYLLKKNTIVNLRAVDLFQVDIPGQLRFAVPKNLPILRDILQKGLDAISQQERDAILASYIDAEAGFKQKVFSLTGAQWDWLNAHKVITFGADPARPPLEFVGQEGTYQGIASEYVAVAQDKLKTTFEPIAGLSWAEARERAMRGLIDVLPCVAPSEKLREGLLFTEPYLSYPIVIFSLSDAALISGLNDVPGSKVAVVANEYIQELLDKKYPQLELVVFETVADAMRAVSLGHVEYFVVDMASGAYAADSLGLKNVKVAASTEYKLSLSMGVRKDWPELVAILNQVLASIDKEEASEMKSQWMAIRFEHGLDIWTVLKWGLPIAAGLTLIIVVIVVWNRRLDREIAARKIVEEELRVKEQRLRSYFTTSQIGVTLSHPDKGWIEVNDRAQEMFGYSFDELKRLTWTDLTHPDDLEADLLQYQRMLDGEIDHYIMDKRFIRKDGGVLYTNFAVSCVRNEAHEVYMVMGSHVDITERVEARRERDEAFEVITGSINYATNIQNAILPSKSSMEKAVAEHFILWEPRDKVGGDIYFLKPWGQGQIVALGDCTGHGVPGAFMTLIVNGALEMAIHEVPPGEVGRLLQRTHQLIQKALDQDQQEGSSDDGIEMGICYLSPQMENMIYAGARFSLFHVRDGGVEEIKGDKKGLGYRGIPTDVVFNNKEISLDEAGIFYMTTDGLIDQVGGPKQRGFGKKRFKNLLLELENMAMEQRADEIRLALARYQGEQKRRDDVAVIGFRLG